MGMYINSATGSLRLTRSLYQTSVMQSTTMKRLSSGIRINSASDDAAGLSLSEKLKSSINGNTVAKNNAQTGIALLNTADSALSNMTNSLERIRNLAVQAANGVYTSEERQMLQKEVGQLSADIGQTYQSARFSDKNVFGAQQGVTIGTTQVNQLSEAQINAVHPDYQIIRTAADFEKINDNRSGKYILVNDINLSELGTKTLNVISNNFSGILDGNGYSVNNLKIEADPGAGWRAGLFNEVSGTIKNLSVNNASLNILDKNGGILAGDVLSGAVIDNCRVSGSVLSNAGYIGGMVGRVLGGKVSNSSADVTVKGDYCVGGITGILDNGAIIDNCISSGSVTSTGGGGGGLIGSIFAGGLAKNSTSSANVTGTTNADMGGLVGNSDGTILNSSASGNISSSHWNTGGLIGRNGASGVISGCYATGNSSTTSLGAGGFAGGNAGTITNSYCTGNVYGGWSSGGFVGNNTGTIQSSYTTSYTTGTVMNDIGGFTGAPGGNSDASCFYKNNLTYNLGNATNANTSTLPTASWDANAWDTSGGVPALKNVQRAYGTSTGLLGLQIGDTATSTSKIDINTAFGLGDTNFTVSGQDSARNTITQVDQLMSFLNTMRSEVGASVNKLSSIISIQDNRVNNLSASRSNINDADVASESAQMIKNQIRQQSGVALLSQMNGLDKNLLMQLIG